MKARLRKRKGGIVAGRCRANKKYVETLADAGCWLLDAASTGEKLQLDNGQ